MTPPCIRSDASGRLTRSAGVLALAWGALLLGRGPDVWRAVDGRSPGAVDELAVRFLGARHVVQGGSQLGAPDRFRRLFLGVDLVHAASMFALAVVDERRRRPALVSGITAAAAATIGWGSVTAGRP